MTPEAPGEVAAGLAEAATVALDCWASTLDPPGAPISRSGMVPGSEVADDECCGQVTVTFVRSFFTTAFPDEAVEQTYGEPCVAAEFSVRLVRCVPGVTEGGVAPTDEVLAAAGAALAAEGVVMWAALRDHLGGAFDRDEFVLGPLEAEGPNGRCAGYTVTVTVDLGCLASPPSCG